MTSLNQNFFHSRINKFQALNPTCFPAHSGLRIMMMPVAMNDITSVPPELEGYKKLISTIFENCIVKSGVGYLTIDERLVKEGETHRRAGMHVDGVYKGNPGSWGGGSWGSLEHGMFAISNVMGCKAWNQDYVRGTPGNEGEADHLLEKLHAKNIVYLDQNTLYWLGGMCVHESLPMEKDTYRSFVRLSLPSEGPWFEGYTQNPLGVTPTGPILPRRIFMDN